MLCLKKIIELLENTVVLPTEVAVANEVEFEEL